MDGLLEMEGCLWLSAKIAQGHARCATLAGGDDRDSICLCKIEESQWLCVG